MITVGNHITIDKIQYLVLQNIANGADSEIFIIENSNKEKFILKAFKEKKKAHPKTNHGNFNHYGKVRDAHPDIFKEIEQKSHSHSFLVKHICTIKYVYANQKNISTWRWLLVLEYIEGVTLGTFINNNYQNNLSLVQKAITLLGQTVKEWHQNEFAHGDPHLGNAIVQIDKTGIPIAIKLIDYSQIHNSSFKWCKRCSCFPNDNPDKRFKEDLNNNQCTGKGFLTELKNIALKLNIANSNFELFFNKGYF